MFDNPYRIVKKLSLGETRKFFYTQDTPEQRWTEVAGEDIDNVIHLCKAMKKLVYKGRPKGLVNGLAKVLYEYVYKEHGRYIEDSDFWAEQCGELSRPLMAFIQRQYTLAHIGCSVVVFWDAHAEEMVCVRSLDWNGADDLAPCTRKFVFADNNKQEVGVQVAGIAGMVGMLTGMKEQFSICINYAPWTASARFHADPTFLIRDLLSDDSVITYSDACAAVEGWRTGAPCFITLCGRERKEACVVEFGKGDHKEIRGIADGKDYLVQTNHYDETSPFKKHNKEQYESADFNDDQWYWSKLLKNSLQRRTMLETAMATLPAGKIDIAEHILQRYCEPPLMNFESAQWVVMRPKSQQMDIYFCTRSASCPENPFKKKVTGKGDMY